MQALEPLGFPELQIRRAWTGWSRCRSKTGNQGSMYSNKVLVRVPLRGSFKGLGFKESLAPKYLYRDYLRPKYIRFGYMDL